MWLKGNYINKEYSRKLKQKNLIPYQRLFSLGLNSIGVLFRSVSSHLQKLKY